MKSYVKGKRSEQLSRNQMKIFLKQNCLDHAHRTLNKKVIQD